MLLIQSNQLFPLLKFIDRIGGGTPEEILFIGIQVGSFMVQRMLMAQMHAEPSPEEIAMLEKMMKGSNVGQA